MDSFSARLPAWWLPQNDQNKVPPDEQSTAKQSAGMVEPAADSAKDPAPAPAFGPVVVQGSGGGLSSSLLTSLPQKTNSAPVTPLADLLRNVDVRALHCIGACCCHYPSRTIFPPLTHRAPYVYATRLGSCGSSTTRSKGLGTLKPTTSKRQHTTSSWRWG